MAFGKRVVPPSGGESSPPPPPTPGTVEVVYPWKGRPDQVACNMALGNLAVNLPRWLTTDGRVHAESLLVAAGAVAGFSAQCTLVKTMIETGRLQQGRDYHIVTTTDGKNYLFGDALNDLIVGSVPGDLSRVTLLSLLQGAALQSGVGVEQLPPIEPIFRGVAASLGQARFGRIDAPGHEPHGQPPQMLNLIWPLARKCFTGAVPGDRAWGAAPFEYWSTIGAMAARKMFIDTQGVLDLKIGFRLMMESAIIASKIPAAEVQEGVV